MKGKALRRALATSDAIRVNADIPSIVDKTELITPEVAHEMLQRNKSNRPINWRRVEEYAELMRAGQWKLHAQGIILDTSGNILTGQKRLWAVVYAGVNVYMRVSRGNHPDTAKLIDRGDPQSSRDLASRGSGRKHSPTEAAIARAFMAIMGNLKPTTDQLAECIEANAADVERILNNLSRVKKTREVIMVIAAVLASTAGESMPIEQIPAMAEKLATALLPHTAAQCWGKGAAFGLALRSASEIVAQVK